MDEVAKPKWWSSYGDCPLLNIETDTNKIRLLTEIIQLVGAFLYIVAALRESKFLGYHMFIENLVCERDTFSEFTALYLGLKSQIRIVFVLFYDLNFR